ncbi:Protein ASPARTIC PROTEASE IN GUARD CELL 1 [Hibiscus syriacus]|uniref:Protein ASPARTIC PROTEASE IN GUARD CELL 1 n=1 Tax=Hibiscus syriacus TaxID=106335 RepID=A0A6A3C7Y5_HIBSY|nr:protein ASPARTIC PROTEASE IN GUARD CELL 1-like [Hibiscus syriacus]KAE8724637.1 Protein ASPARTIC PROTEASE IN GUARD CELL 1 [Hibiscus syriacus]
MALLFCIIFAACFFFTAPFVHCSRSLLQISRPTTVLDVSEALEKTRNVLSFTPVGQSLSASPSPTSFLSLHIHPRASIRKSSHPDYKSLTLSRLERDSARVTSLATRLDLSVSGISKPDLKPFNKASEFGAEELGSPIVSGSSQGSGEYFSRVGIGKPPSQVYMVLDTGSDVNWVQCAPCADCYQQSDPIFDPSLSSSYSPLNCETQQCKYLDDSECRNDRTCAYEVSYGDGSYTVGDFVTETITLGSDSVNNVAIGCGHNNEGLFVGAGGLLGLGGGPLSFSSQLNASTFSYCLVDRDSDSASTLEFDYALPPNAITAPLLRNKQLDTFYYLGLTGISVGGELLPIPESVFQIDESGNGGIIIDSGTAVTRLQSDTYNVLRDAFVKGTKNLPSADTVALFDTCYNLSSTSSVDVPTLSFHFPEAKVLPLPAKNYMIPVDSVGTFCFAFAPTSSTLSIIGNVQQQGTRVGFDLGNSHVGFVPNKC